MAPEESGIAKARQNTQCLIGLQREANGRSRLQVSFRLQNAAQNYAEQMVAESFFSHVSPQGQTLQARIKASGYSKRAGVWAAGENLAWGAGLRGSPQDIDRALSQSQAHRNNTLNRSWRHVGVGIVVGVPFGLKEQGATYAIIYGNRWR